MQTDTMSIVRSLIGRRSKITRREMADILAALAAQGLTLYSGYVPGTHKWSTEQQRVVQTEDAHEAWANECVGVRCISVDARGALCDGDIRYDDPGSMHPMQHTQVTFLPADSITSEHNPVPYMRDHCDRLLIVSGDALVPPVAPLVPPQWIARMRRWPEVDGTWVRILDDGTLEMRDPNDGQSQDPADKARYQYRVEPGEGLLRRVLPPQRVGDAWLDVGVPEWEPAGEPVGGVLAAYWEERGL